MAVGQKAKGDKCGTDNNHTRSLLAHRMFLQGRSENGTVNVMQFRCRFEVTRHRPASMTRKARKITITHGTAGAFEGCVLPAVQKPVGAGVQSRPEGDTPGPPILVPWTYFTLDAFSRQILRFQLDVLECAGSHRHSRGANDRKKWGEFQHENPNLSSRIAQKTPRAWLSISQARDSGRVILPAR